MLTNEHQGQVVLITGGAQGIGRVVTERLHHEGYRVSVLEQDREAVAEWEKGILPEGIHLYTGNVGSEKEVKAWIAKTVSEVGTPYHLINNAAISANKPIQKLKLSEWKAVLDTNLTGTFLCSKYASPFLQRHSGSIINLCSTRAFMSEADTEAYSATKGGIFALTHALAISLGPDVKVNAISPGWIDVSAVRKSTEANQIRLTEEDHKQHPVGRVGRPEDIANLIVFLLDARNSFITGQNFIIDGGMTRKMIYA
ncbi:SDR family oxidoreductase [Telluribacter sp.]|jgi:NAD(P)-dependent dehydrogenase (short-subunit alcohol dehydrogenase family)|uniref:SDR family oxidoreductase n=1 Tax=Telluribacter sp. TaxID=1978767 RepID=UPI002E0F130E|nr:SDR family oxidoreductase [Telluribacter sp.]